ncbi:diadenosine tetraphosphate hydrolase [Actinoplanes sp. TRM 88003]|uniref:Diadenosine tetraphosphate hydrolase n=1 Tax=Paractinoplanes aksuensis TaxID=2939490 RepID=A0ABT1DUK3_9ACTN|nr:diadenosine tetraphosphate hydrolase [Actinoplanes aksuensis]MCO8274507.1 diadenosine tetraphosphate hydrolase [Actinoplanes aksuensis]
MADWRNDRIGAALRGDNPTVLARLEASFAVIGDHQFLPGYCVLLTDDPAVTCLTDLPRARRLAFLADMDLLGEAVTNVCQRFDSAFRRVNFSILGNLDPYLHAHVQARYTWEPADMAKGPVWGYPRQTRLAAETALDRQHDALRSELTREIKRLAAS